MTYDSPFKDGHGNPMPYITIHTLRSKGEIQLPLGRNYFYKRQQGAITLVVNVDAVTPIAVEFDLNPDGTWTWRGTLLGRGDNHYIHPTEPLYPPDNVHYVLNPFRKPPTEEQRRTIARWCFHDDERPFGCGSGPGAPLKEWAALSIEEAERLGGPKQKQKPYYT